MSRGPCVQLATALALSFVAAVATPSFSERTAHAELPREWRPLAAPDGSFRLSIPGEPTFHESSRPTAGGLVRGSFWRFVLGTLEMVVELHELPRIGTLLVTDDWILSRVANSLVEDVKGSLLSERRELRTGRPARRLSYEIPGAATRLEEALIVVDRARVYVLTATRQRDAERPAAFDQFFASFELRGEGQE
jgi:hypothetical protein